MFRDNVDLPSIEFAILSMLSLQYHPPCRFGEPIVSHKTITLTSNISACLNQTRKIALPCCHTRNSPPIALPFSHQFHCTLRLRKGYIDIYIYKPRLRRSMVRIFSPVLFSPRNAESGNSLEKRTDGRLSDRETKPEFPADANHFQKYSIRVDKRLSLRCSAALSHPRSRNVSRGL